MKINNYKLIVGLISGLFISATAYADTTQQTTNSKNTQNILQQTRQTISDSTITLEIKAKFMKDSLLNPLDIGVTTKNSIVQLTGKVNTDMEYEQAIMLAESTDGVNSVDAKQLMVKDSTHPLNDIYITAKVKGLLLKEKIMGKDVQYWPIEIETKNNVVYLKGSVDNDQQKQTIGQIAKSVDGVKSVTNAIVVKNQSN